MPNKLNTRIKKELKDTLQEQKEYHSEMFKSRIKQAFIDKYNNKAKASLFEEFANEVQLTKYDHVEQQQAVSEAMEDTSIVPSSKGNFEAIEPSDRQELGSLIEDDGGSLGSDVESDDYWLNKWIKY